MYIYAYTKPSQWQIVNDSQYQVFNFIELQLVSTQFLTNSFDSFFVNSQKQTLSFLNYVEIFITQTSFHFTKCKQLEYYPFISKLFTLIKKYTQTYHVSV